MIAKDTKIILTILGVVAPVILALALGGIYAVLDARHEPAGAVAKSDLRQIDREILETQDLQANAPSELYSVSRENKVRRLKLERRQLRDELQLAPMDDE